MTPNQLILRKEKSNFPGFPDITLGSVMSHSELDGNFIYLKGEVIHDVVMDADTNLIFRKINGSNITVPFSGVTITGVTSDTFVINGNYSNNKITFNNNDGGSFEVTGITDTNIFPTGLTFDNSTDTLTLKNNDNSIVSVSGITSNLTDTYLTGGTINGNTGVLSLSNNNGDSFNINGFGDLDTYLTGGTYNSETKNLKLINNKNGVFEVSIDNGLENETVTGGTLSNGTIVFTTNKGTTFNVTGFQSNQDTFISSGTVNNGTLTLVTNQGSNVVISGFTSGSTNSSGLERIDEGSGDGLVKVGRNTSFYGPIGSNAVDLSNSTSASTNRGALGDNSLASGLNTSAIGNNSFVTGVDSIANGENSAAFGELTLASGFNSLAGGVSSQATANFSFAFGNGAQANNDGAVSFGSSIVSGLYGFAAGRGLYSRYSNEAVFGKYNVDYSSTPPSGETKLFTVGNGISTSNRNDAFAIYENGATYFDPITLASVSTPKQGMYAYDSDDNQPKYYDGSTWKGFSVGDTYITGGTYDSANSKITFTDNNNTSFDVTGITLNNISYEEVYESYEAVGDEIGYKLSYSVQLSKHYQVFRNGQLEFQSAENGDYTLDENDSKTIRFDKALQAEEVIQVYYKRLSNETPESGGPIIPQVG